MFLKFVKVKVKKTKTILQKYFHPSALDQLIYAHVKCQEPKKVPTLKKTTGVLPL